eukprot:CAMPEP_0170604270 /NCGR_PEP_ID=MMETSP0224-20130122/19334_1 /TAXON_ID=285029 /ORGANISM="Togula jolla, Strain CCCM 725" /LENGTH=505 /DNA_ID=CAMNT_0010929163 /DNA_START=45 /DNA_END=1562 /DNA_ORIENTATION=-
MAAWVALPVALPTASIQKAARGREPQPALQRPVTLAATGRGAEFAAGASPFLAGAAGLWSATRSRRRRRNASVQLAAAAEGVKAKPASKGIAKGVLARLRTRSPKTAGKKMKKMPPKPDAWELDEEGRRIYPWPKSFAEIVQTAATSTLNLIHEGETRVEVDFPPLPLADLDWNTCDVSETRIVDSNIQHAIAFSKLLIKDPRPLPVLDVEEANKAAKAGAEPAEPDKINELLERKFKKNPLASPNQKRTVRMLFPNKPDMLRARDIHYEKWRKMDRPDLLRRGYYNEVNDDTWEGPFEDIYVFIIAQNAGELPKIRSYVEKADAVAAKQGRVLRHVLFNLNCNKLRNDIAFFKTVVPFRPGLATPQVHFDFLATFRNAYLIRFGKYTMTVLRDPYNINYLGALYRAYPGPWQIFLQDEDGTYRTIDVHDKRPSIVAVKRKLMRAVGLAKDALLPEEAIWDDVYRPKNEKAGTLRIGTDFTREGFGDAQWWEADFDSECSEKWRL